MIKPFGWEKRSKAQISKYVKNLSPKFSDLRQALENLQLLDSCDYDNGYLHYIVSKVTRVTQFRGSFICYSVGALGLIYDIDISASF